MTKTNKMTAKTYTYQITLEGRLGSQWTAWFEGFTITQEESGNTLLTGAVVDQAALFGLLRKVRDLGLPLISLARIEPAPVDAADRK